MGAGDYLVFYKAESEFTVMNPLRKLVLNVKAPVECKLASLDSSEFLSVYGELETYLMRRNQQKENYYQPSI